MRVGALLTVVPIAGALLFGQLLAACNAESLGVDLPKGGPDAISQEDLQRDLWGLTTDPPPAPGQSGPLQAAGPGQHFEQRIQQMHTLPAFGNSYRSGSIICGMKDGRSGKAIVIAALPQGQGAVASGVPAAAVISLAKAWDEPKPPKHTLVFCLLPDSTGLDAYAAKPAMPLDSTIAVVTVGPIVGASVDATDRGMLGAARRVHLHAGAPDWMGTADDRMERIDFRVLAERVRDAYDLIVALP